MIAFLGCRAVRWNCRWQTPSRRRSIRRQMVLGKRCSPDGSFVFLTVLLTVLLAVLLAVLFAVFLQAKVSAHKDPAALALRSQTYYCLHLQAIHKPLSPFLQGAGKIAKSALFDSHNSVIQNRCPGLTTTAPESPRQ